MVSQTICSVVIFSHRFLDSDCISFKTFAFLAVYWPFWTSLYNTDIKVKKKKKNWSSTMLNNVFNIQVLIFCLILILFYFRANTWIHLCNVTFKCRHSNYVPIFFFFCHLIMLKMGVNPYLRMDFMFCFVSGYMYLGFHCGLIFTFYRLQIVKVTSEVTV